ncbi:hypothetical protein LH464_06530 [Neorhizobium sp. T786]|nr:hypothetical protein [Neorhizobium xiangyangii]
MSIALLLEGNHHVCPLAGGSKIARQTPERDVISSKHGLCHGEIRPGQI